MLIEYLIKILSSITHGDFMIPALAILVIILIFKVCINIFILNTILTNKFNRTLTKLEIDNKNIKEDIKKINYKLK